MQRSRQSKIGSNLEVMYSLFGDRAEACEFKIREASRVTGVMLKDLPLKPGLIISFIGRDGKIIIPTGSDQINIGDNVMVVTMNKGFTEISDILR